MDGLKWLSRFVVPARSGTGSATQVVVGVLDTADGPKRALRIGEGEPAFLPRQAMDELITHSRTVMDENIPEDRT